MQLVNPIWLWALTGLAIPIAIHVLSRKEGKVIRIGSLRHLQETNTQQFKGIRLNEIVLLALRCTLIVLFVLMLCGLSFEREKAIETKWVLIEKGLETIPAVQTQLDTFESNGYEVRWLSNGFPLFADSATLTVDNLYWRLVEQLQREKADDIIVISKSNLRNFKGKRPKLPANIRWMSVAGAEVEFPVKAITQGDSVVVRKGHSQADKTYFTTQLFSRSNWNSPTQLTSPDSIEIVIVSDDMHRYDKRIVEASLQALKSLYPVSMKILQKTPEQFNSADDGNWCIWLADQPVSDSIATNIVYLKPGIDPEILVQENSNRWIITKRLNEEIALNESLTVKLTALLLSSEKDWEIAHRNDERVLADESLWSNYESGNALGATLATQSADSYLLILFLLTLLIERLLAYHRNQ